MSYFGSDRLGFCAIAFLASLVSLSGCTHFSTLPVPTGGPAPKAPPRFNEYILRSVAELAKDRSGLGYGPHAYTEELKFGTNESLSATKPPLTMCVAAQMEVLVRAMNIYAMETGDNSPFNFLPAKSWQRLRPTDLKGQIWLVENSNSTGAADAFANHGMGARVRFEELVPGDFVNFNRSNGSGHGVIFMGFIDSLGNEQSEYSTEVSGFRYFSSQGNETDGGLGFRYAFFHPHCPRLSNGMRRDCGVIPAKTKRFFTAGYVSMPSHWSRPVGGRTAIESTYEGSFDSAYFTGETTD